MSTFKFPAFWRRSQDYLELEKEDGQSSEDVSTRNATRTRTQPRGFIVSCIMNVILSGVILFFYFVNPPASWTKSPRDLIKAISAPSPVLAQVPLTLSLKRFNGSFLDESETPNIYRAMPSKEVDAAWHKFTPTWITVSEDEIRMVGKNLSTLVKAPEEWGKGPNRYLAMMDIGHQLHCVNALRKMAFPNDYPTDWGNRADFQREHLMHCVHVLYENIMCTGTTELITYNWVETQTAPVPDFSLDKMCKNSDAILDFQAREQLSDANYFRDRMVKPEDAVTLPLPPHLKAFLEAHPDA